jgi:hypothetical protein
MLISSPKCPHRNTQHTAWQDLPPHGPLKSAHKINHGRIQNPKSSSWNDWVTLYQLSRSGVDRPTSLPVGPAQTKCLRQSTQQEKTFILALFLWNLQAFAEWVNYPGLRGIPTHIRYKKNAHRAAFLPCHWCLKTDSPSPLWHLDGDTWGPGLQEVDVVSHLGGKDAQKNPGFLARLPLN